MIVQGFFMLLQQFLDSDCGFNAFSRFFLPYLDTRTVLFYGAIATAIGPQPLSLVY